MEDTFYSWPLEKSFSPGCMIRFQGVAHRSGSRFEISVQCGTDIDKSGCALLSTFSFDKTAFLVNKSYVVGKGWQQEERHEELPIIPGEDFEIVIVCEVTKFKVAINGYHFCDFTHILPFTSVKLAEIRGDITLSLISFEDCTLPQPSKIEAGYPSQ